jgi:hypothetical protein
MARFDAILVSEDDPQPQLDRSLIDPSRRTNESSSGEVYACQCKPECASLELCLMGLVGRV